MMHDAPYVLEFPVLGRRVRFTTDCERVASIVSDRFSCWSIVDPRDIAFAPPLTVSIHVHDGPEGDAAMRYLCPDASRVIAHSAGSVGVSDPERGASVVDVSRELVDDPARFYDSMLESMTFALLAHFDRHPLHASAVASDGHALLLAGPSGAGKSTLASTAHAAGFTVIAEDRVWVQLEPELRVWSAGWPIRIHLANETGGKDALSLGGVATSERLAARRATVCLLDHGRGSPHLERLEPEEIERALSSHVAPGFDRFPNRHPAVVRALAGDGGWRLSLSSDPAEALPLLHRALAS